MLNEIRNVFKKELIFLLKDKKTFIFSFILPGILVFIMLFFISLSNDLFKNTSENNTITIAMDSERNSLYGFLKSEPNIKIISEENIKENFRNNKISLYI